MKTAFAAVLLICALGPADPVVDRTLAAPDGDITGLGFGEGSLWAVDNVSETVYRLDPVTGSVEDSWVCTQTGSRIATGLTFASNAVYVAAATGSSYSDPYCYRYSTSGGYLGSFDLDC